MPDIRTTMCLAALSAFLMGAGMFITARSYTSYIQGMQRWGWSCCLQSAGWVFLYLRGSISDFVTVIISSLLMLSSLALHDHALHEFQRKPFTGSRKLLPYAIVAIACLYFLYYTYVVKDISARVVVFSFLGAPLHFLCAHTILAYNKQNRHFSYWLTGFGFICYGLASVGRGIYVYIFDPPISNIFAQAPLQSITFTLVYVTVIVQNFGFMLMCIDSFNTQLKTLATRDTLTESLNRGTIELLLHKEVSQSSRTDSPLSLLMIDIDHFKTVNDTYGHTTGDRVLRNFVATIQKHLRTHDLLGRYGGEEFIVLLPDTDSNEAIPVAERLRKAVNEAILDERIPDFHCTTSIGIATLLPKEDDSNALLQRADAALYRAKHEGRNRALAG
jgi:diguanylate cyclase (GGDEF)-like protein